MYVVKISDGLGNQMFQYAFARKLQLMSNKKVYLDTRFINNEDRPLKDGEKNIFFKKSDHREYGLEHFKIRIPVAEDKVLFPWKFLKCENEIDKILFQLSKNNMWIYQYFREKPDNKVSIMEQINKNAPTYLEGYFFKLEYFDDIKHILQRDFKLKKTIKLSRELKEILKEGKTVSIHVRRGDFLKLNRDISQKGYYSNAIAIMGRYIENPNWLIFSDDIEWVKENLDIPDKKIYVSEMGYKDYEELMIMKNCKNHIVANSTFSFWAAYLNSEPEKKVICPKRWKPEIVPKDWIKA